jgi:hypothetical protein
MPSDIIRDGGIGTTTDVKVYASVAYAGVNQALPQPAQTTFISFDTNVVLSNSGQHSTTGGTTALTGTVAKTSGAATLTGTGTAFLSELTSGQKIVVGAETAVVANISSNTVAGICALNSAAGTWTASGSGIAATVDNRSKLTVTDSGIYIINGAAWLDNTTGQAILTIFKGTGNAPAGMVDAVGAGGTVGPRLFTSTPPVQLVAGDALWLAAYQNSVTAGRVVTTVSGRAPVFGFFKIAN